MAGSQPSAAVALHASSRKRPTGGDGEGAAHIPVVGIYDEVWMWRNREGHECGPDSLCKLQALLKDSYLDCTAPLYHKEKRGKATLGEVLTAFQHAAARHEQRAGERGVQTPNPHCNAANKPSLCTSAM